MDSKMVKTYVHLSLRDIEDKIIYLSQEGLNISDLEEFKKFLLDLYNFYKKLKLNCLISRKECIN